MHTHGLDRVQRNQRRCTKQQIYLMQLEYLFKTGSFRRGIVRSPLRPGIERAPRIRGSFGSFRGTYLAEEGASQVSLFRDRCFAQVHAWNTE